MKNNKEKNNMKEHMMLRLKKNNRDKRDLLVLRICSWAESPEEERCTHIINKNKLLSWNQLSY